MSVSIVMPVYNEEEIIEKVIRQYHTEIVTKVTGSEFIVVNDGSTDSTHAIIGRLAKELRIKIVDLEKNSGHSRALLAGFNQARNPLVFHVDGDDQFKAEDFWKLYPLTEDNDIVLGWRIPRRDPLHRRAISLIARLLVVILFGTDNKDINSPFKFIKTRVLREIINDVPANSFAISILILLLARHKGYRIAEVPITHFARTTGKSTLTNLRYLLRGCFLCIRDILWIRKQTFCNKTSSQTIMAGVWRQE